MFFLHDVQRQAGPALDEWESIEKMLSDAASTLSTEDTLQWLQPTFGASAPLTGSRLMLDFLHHVCELDPKVFQGILICISSSDSLTAPYEPMNLDVDCRDVTNRQPPLASRPWCISMLRNARWMVMKTNGILQLISQ
jgi:hypothetical protein